MHLQAAVLGKGVGEFEGVELYVCVAVGEALDHGCHGIFRTAVFGSDFVDDILMMKY